MYLVDLVAVFDGVAICGDEGRGGTRVESRQISERVTDYVTDDPEFFWDSCDN